MAQIQKDEDHDILPGITLRYVFRGHSDEITQIAWSPNGRILASGSKDTTIRLWDAQTGQALRSLKGHSFSVHGIAGSRDGHILFSGSGDKTIQLWNTQTGQALQTLTGHSGTVFSVAWSPDMRSEEH